MAAVPLDERERLARLAAGDGYRIVGEIGRGPRSTVYRALHEPLQQIVALKVFPAGLCTREEWEARLQRGAELWAALAHAQIVPIHRAGWWDGVPYLALEHVPHGSLTDRLADQSPLSSPSATRGEGRVRSAFRLVGQLAEIVGYLHRQGVVHGNLKPSNVLLAADDIPRLADFHLTGGLFLGPLPSDERKPGPLHAECEADSVPTELKESAGLAYLAPELLQNPGSELRPPTDIYGLGVILYELLTGRPPFGGGTTREMLEQVRSQDPVPPSQLNTEVTPQLEAFCLRCLRKNPWRRYARAYDLVTRLRHCSDDRPRPAGR